MLDVKGSLKIIVKYCTIDFRLQVLVGPLRKHFPLSHDSNVPTEQLSTLHFKTMASQMGLSAFVIYNMDSGK